MCTSFLPYYPSLNMGFPEVLDSRGNVTYVFHRQWKAPKTFHVLDPVFDQTLFTIRDRPSAGTLLDV